jgi:hypothetical protein
MWHYSYSPPVTHLARANARVIGFHPLPVPAGVAGAMTQITVRTPLSGLGAPPTRAVRGHSIGMVASDATRAPIPHPPFARRVLK